MGMVELGNVGDIQDEIMNTLIMIKKEKNNDVRLALYNYVGNLYSALSVITGEWMYPNRKKIFGRRDNYHRFMKSTNFFTDRFIDNFIAHKEFHQDYFNDVLVDIENIFVSEIDGAEYSRQSDYFGEKNFYEVFHDFCKSLGLEKLYVELVTERRIFEMTKGRDFDNYLGLNLHNPMTGVSNILLDSFDYNLDTMFTLAHEVGHYYDLREFAGHEKINDFVNYTFKSVYQEVMSRLFEKLFLEYLIKNKIMSEKAIDKLIDVEIINHDYIFSTYILTLLDDKYLNKERYRNLRKSSLVKEVGKYFENIEAIESFIGNAEFDLMQDINYAYGDILAMFLKDEVLAEGLDAVLMRKFKDIRCSEFSEEFFLKEGLSPDKYSGLYKTEIQLIKK